MNCTGIILARAGSKGLPHKNILPVCGKPMIAWTIEHTLGCQSLDQIVLSTDDRNMAEVGSHYQIEVVWRPDHLASDTATVDSAARHAVEEIETKYAAHFNYVAVLYGNVPVRPSDLTDRAIEKLQRTGCDSVQSVCPVGKMHPYWMKKLEGDECDFLTQYEPNEIYRRQDLPPVYILDGGIIAVTRSCLFNVVAERPHSFLGMNRRAIVTEPGQVIDVDSQFDLDLAQTILQTKAAHGEAA